MTEASAKPSAPTAGIQPNHLRKDKLGLFGMFGAGNLGNESTLQAMLYNLRRYRPDADVRCICAEPSEVASSYGIPGIAIRGLPLPPAKNRVLRLLRRIFLGIPFELYRWFATVKSLNGTSMLVMTGTGMLSDTGISPFGLHYDILRWSLAAKLCQCKVMFVSVGVGPIRHPLSRLFVKSSLRLANYRSYRDAFSINYAEALGLPSKSHRLYPDLAFSLPRPVPAPCTRDRRRRVIGIGLITDDKRRASAEESETVYRSYVGSMAEFITWLTAHDYAVRLLIGDVEYDRRIRQDLRTILEPKGLYEAGDLIDSPASTVDELLSQLAQTDIVVASRFHNVLLALRLGKPVVAISFHEKVASLMAAVGLSEFCQDIEHVDVGTLIEQLRRLEEDSVKVTHGIQQVARQYQAALEEQYELIFTK